MEYFAGGSTLTWQTFPPSASNHSGSGFGPPATAAGQCSEIIGNVTVLVGGTALNTTACVGLTETAEACAEKCLADTRCHFYTWHDQHQGSFKHKCFFRYDDCFSEHRQDGHFRCVETPLLLSVSFRSFPIELARQTGPSLENPLKTRAGAAACLLAVSATTPEPTPSHCAPPARAAPPLQKGSLCLVRRTYLNAPAPGE